MDARERGREVLRKIREKKEAEEVAEEVEDAPTPKRVASAEEVSKELDVTVIEPNNWNPNVVDKQQMVKLKNGVKMLLDKGMRPPPIVVRARSGGRYQIIDGFHRWTTFKELKQATIPAYVLNVDDKTARILTDTLNYLRGQPDEDKYSDLIADLIVTQGASLDELSTLLPESHDELVDILAAHDSGLKALLMIEEQEKLAKKDEEEEAENDENLWMDITFRVSKSQARVIEKEITRIEGTLDGKNRRGRALEYMSVMSGQTPLEAPETPSKPVVKAPKKKKGS